jgi:hypothetical protein
VRIFKNSWFARFAEKEGISDGELKKIVNRLETEKVDANLGGDVYKVRVARSGKGKAGGYRVIVFYKIGKLMFFVYGFAKSERDNINDKELKTFKEAAKEYFNMTSDQIRERVEHGQLIELEGDQL